MAIKKKKISDYTFDKTNINKGSEFGDSLLEKSMRETGLGRSVLADKNGVLIAGNKTLQKAAELGFTDIIEVETDGKQLVVVKRNDLDINTADGAKMKILDNTVSKHNYVEDADVMEAVCEEYELEPVQFGLTVPEKDLSDFDDNFDALPPAEPITKTGDLYEIEQHRLLCGDSTKEEDVKKLMQGQKADITIQSPPYNINKVTKFVGNKYINDKDAKSNIEYLKLLELSTTHAVNNSVFSFVNIQSIAGNKISVIDYLAILKNWFCDYIIWDKMQAEPAMGMNILNSRFEFVLVFAESAKRKIGVKKFRGNLENIIFIKSRQGNEFSKVHKAIYPVAFPAYFIENFSVQSCLDLFIGCGTTMVAAHQLNRKCYGMEIAPNYCDVIVARMIKLIMAGGTALPSIRRNGVALNQAEIQRYLENISA
jgi:DNA modification methylase